MTNFMPVHLYNRHEKGDEMYYELYIDSLFLVNFVMNLYLLLLVNRSLFRTATRKRLILGAMVGALLYFLPFFGEGPLWFKMILGIFPSEIGMIVIAFQVRNIRAFFKILEKVLMYSLLLGGIILLGRRKLSWLDGDAMGIWGILGLGAVSYLLFGYLIERKSKSDNLCRVTLTGKGSRITVTALVDSGNSLVEPISGKPVSVIEKDIIADLWTEEPLYRMIPYHSIGKKRGIMKGYLLPEMQIETNGVTKICKETYVAVCEEYISSRGDNNESPVKMILNPKLLEEQDSKDLKVRERMKRISEERYG